MSSESGPDAPPSYQVAVASQEGGHYLDTRFNIVKNYAAKNKEQEWSKVEFAKMQEKYAQHVRRKKKPSASEFATLYNSCCE